MNRWDALVMAALLITVLVLAALGKLTGSELMPILLGVVAYPATRKAGGAARTAVAGKVDNGQDRQ